MNIKTTSIKTSLCLLLAVTPLAQAQVSNLAVIQKSSDGIDAKAFIKSLNDNRNYNPKLRDESSDLSINSNNPHFQIKQYSFENGKLTISGALKGKPDSSFVFRGDLSKIEGFAIDPQSDSALKYTTDARGKLVITVVPVATIFPDRDPNWKNAIEVYRRSIQANGRSASNMLAPPVQNPMANGQAPHIGSYKNQNFLALQSRPGASKVIFLDYSQLLNTDGSIKQINSDVDGNGVRLISVTAEDYFKIWQTVSSQYSMYDVNVTTSRAVYDATPTQNSLRMQHENRSCTSSAGYNTFGTTTAGTICNNTFGGQEWGFGTGQTVAHEVGHALGLEHDGDTRTAGWDTVYGNYYLGLANYQWVPIMGNYWAGSTWSNQLNTFSKGEYTGATNPSSVVNGKNTSNFQDDLAVVNRYLPFKVDDNPNGKELIFSNGSVSANTNFGQIERTGDVDRFSFTVTTAGTLNLNVEPIEYAGMLDVSVRLLNASNQVLATNNPTANRKAALSNLSLNNGTYTLEVSGGAEGTPQDGFSNYSSLGYYGIAGSFTGGVGSSYPTLQSGVSQKTTTGTKGTWKYYVIDVPANKASLTINLSGGTGDPDLYVLLGSAPTNTGASYASPTGCKSTAATATEACTITKPTSGRYTIGIYGYSNYDPVTILATIK